MIQIKPILAALRRHKAGTVLIALQIALTLAIVCNALFIIHQRLDRLAEPTGVDEPSIFVISNQWAQQMSTQQVDAQIRTDLAALRQLPSVREATVSNACPLCGNGWDNFITMKPDQVEPTTDGSVYMVDEHFIDALGLKLIAGRNFRADEIEQIGLRQSVHPPSVIITKALADKLYPDGSALGKQFYSMNTSPMTVIGIVDRLQRETSETWEDEYAYQGMLWPVRMDMPGGMYYVVRAKPGQLADAMREAPQALYAQSRMRMIDPKNGLLSFAEIRQRAYAGDRGMALLMGIIIALLLAITGAGIVGLTSFWVGQRRKQIGVRRALGATHRDILSYFLTENLLISLGGALVGIVLAFCLNLWLVTNFEMARLPVWYVLTGVVLLLLLGQCAVLAPALRASRVPPVEATRIA